MYGAILGDIIGEPFEFDRGNKSKQFPLFSDNPQFTDDSVMSIAVCEGILNAGLDADEAAMKESMVKSMRTWGHRLAGFSTLLNVPARLPAGLLKFPTIIPKALRGLNQLPPSSGWPGTAFPKTRSRNMWKKSSSTN